MNFHLVKILVFLCGLINAEAALCQVFKNQDTALKSVFGNVADVQRKTIFLTDDQAAQIQKVAKTKIGSKIVTYYSGLKPDSTTAYVFFETNIVRTKRETFMVVLNPDATVASVEMLAFYEPRDYLPRENWFKLFTNKFLNENFWPKREIHAVSGATLTVRAVTLGVRKIMALYQVAIIEEN